MDDCLICVTVGAMSNNAVEPPDNWKEARAAAE